MDQIAKLLLCNYPSFACNLQCEYCYITNQNLWKSKVKKLTHSPAEIVSVMSKERVGGTAFINLCASGETLIPHEAVDLIRGWAETGHYVEVVTNGTLTKRFYEISQFPCEVRKHIAFKFSFHYLELIRLGLLDCFFENVWLMHRSGCAFTVEITPYDKLDAYKQVIMDICMEKLGSYCHVTIARDDMRKKIPVMSSKTLSEYCDFWSDFNSFMLEFKRSIFGIKRKEFCYAGLYSITIDIASGNYAKCYGLPAIGNLFCDTGMPLKYEAIGRCHLPHCYNGHSLLSFGMIPMIRDSNYAQIRNIHLKDGTDSLSETFKGIFGQRISDHCAPLSRGERMKIYRKELCSQCVARTKKRMKRITRNLIRRGQRMILPAK